MSFGIASRLNRACLWGNLRQLILIVPLKIPPDCSSLSNDPKTADYVTLYRFALDPSQSLAAMPRRYRRA